MGKMTIREQGHGENFNAGISVPILYPDVSSCITVTFITEQRGKPMIVGGVHISQPPPGPDPSESDPDRLKQYQIVCWNQITRYLYGMKQKFFMTVKEGLKLVNAPAKADRAWLVGQIACWEGANDTLANLEHVRAWIRLNATDFNDKEKDTASVVADLRREIAAKENPIPANASREVRLALRQKRDSAATKLIEANQQSANITIDPNTRIGTISDRYNPGSLYTWFI